jgi:hypothetical protein
MSTAYTYLNFGLIVWLLLAFASNAIAETPKEQVQAGSDRVSTALSTTVFCIGLLRRTFPVKHFYRYENVMIETGQEISVKAI